MFDEAAAELGFTHCVAAGHEGLLRLLFARGLRVPPTVTYCQTYLWRSLPPARLLLEYGMDPDLPNWQQIRPLHHQAGSGDVAAARLFLEFGADPDAVDEEYRSTPLGWAARRRATRVRAVPAGPPRTRRTGGGPGLGPCARLGTAPRVPRDRHPARERGRLTGH